MVFGLSALNRVYNFKRVCPGPVLDRVWLQDRRRVFGNPKSETLVCIYFSEQCSRRLSFHLWFTAVNAKFWEFLSSLLVSVLFYLL